MNQETAEIRQARTESVAREQAELQGGQRLESFLAANRHWLTPPLELYRGLAYEYRQERSHLERVWFDQTGNVLVELTATAESPTTPTRQLAWLADGRKVTADPARPYVRIEEPTSTSSPFHGDWNLQCMTMGLALDNALTRLARRPENFRTEFRPAGGGDHPTLILHPTQRSQLHTGTMLMFTSWAYMHHVDYDRAEIVLDAATQRPLEEHLYMGDQLKGRYWYEDWFDTPAGAMPGRIRALIPNEKDKQDQALEMDAHFRQVRPGVRMLDRVRSTFRGSQSGSTGTLTVLEPNKTDRAPLSDILARVRLSGQIGKSLAEAPKGQLEAEQMPGEWRPFFLQADWNPEARESAERAYDSDLPTPPPPLLGLHKARWRVGADGHATVELQGFANTYWKEYLTQWAVELRGDDGRLMARDTLDGSVRTEGYPAAFRVRFDGLKAVIAEGRPIRLVVRGTVLRLAGMYHGHGLWMRMDTPQEKQGLNVRNLTADLRDQP